MTECKWRVLPIVLTGGLWAALLIGGVYTFLTFNLERNALLLQQAGKLSVTGKDASKDDTSHAARSMASTADGQLTVQKRFEEVTLEHNLTEICSEEYKEAEYLKVQHSGWPKLFQGWCEYPRCESYTVDNMLKSLRRRNRTALLEMQPCDLYKLIFGRTLWIVGDSQSQYFYRTIRCSLREFYKEQGVQDKPFTTDEAEATFLQEKVFLDYSGGVGMPICTELVGDTKICHARVNMGWHFVDQYLPNLDLFKVKKTDLFVFNIGLWHHRIENVYADIAQNISNYYQEHKEELPIMIWRDNSPQHFVIEHGEFPHPRDVGKHLSFPIRCQPIEGVNIDENGFLYGNDTHVVTGGWRNHISEPIIKGAGIHYIHTWNETALLWRMHTTQENGNRECTHFCFPGPYHVWVWALHDLLQDLISAEELPPPEWALS